MSKTLLNQELIFRAEKKFKLPELAFNTFEAKKYGLILWVTVHIRVNLTNFISTPHLYNLYEQDIMSINPIATMKQQSFFKEIPTALLVNKIIAGKSRHCTKRGFEGIEYISCEFIQKKNI